MITIRVPELKTFGNFLVEEDDMELDVFESLEDLADWLVCERPDVAEQLRNEQLRNESINSEIEVLLDESEKGELSNWLEEKFFQENGGVIINYEKEN